MMPWHPPHGLDLVLQLRDLVLGGGIAIAADVFEEFAQGLLQVVEGR
jgi:hypothetical protein